MNDAVWPPLALSEWQDTKDTLLLYLQMAGKLRVALSPPEREFAHVALYTTSRGLTTTPIPLRKRTFQVDFDFLAHEVAITTSDGGRRTVALHPPRSVADFYQAFNSALAELKIDVDINPIPQELPDLTPFDKDTHHKSYDTDSVHRFWQILVNADALLKEYRAPFRGRHSPVQLFWGGLDLCYTRYSGQPATPPPGANRLYRLSMDAEEIYAGFWPGDARFPEMAFSSYVYPRPVGIEKAQIRPATAAWNDQLGLFVLRYDDVRTANSPHDTLLEFFKSTYTASATLGGWDKALLH